MMRILIMMVVPPPEFNSLVMKISEEFAKPVRIISEMKSRRNVPYMEKKQIIDFLSLL
jgi:hypothetical protein